MLRIGTTSFIDLNIRDALFALKLAGMRTSSRKNYFGANGFLEKVIVYGHADIVE
jgi:hypothetical protein